MTKPSSPASDRQWTRKQIEQYQAVYPRYKHYAETLQQVLSLAAKTAAPMAIVQARPKAMASFSEKAIRKKDKYHDPLLRMTDLCGARVITQTQAGVQAMSEFIEKHFDVDQANSLDVSRRLKTSEFGYRSVHYVVQLKHGVFPTKEIPLEIPEQLFPDKGCPMKAEIQVRTVLEHAWAGFVHDRVYKGAFTLPDQWQRELAVLAGMLEQVDQSFTQVQAGLEAYEAGYGAYLSEEQLRSEIEILETVLSCDPQNVALAHRIGKLAMALGDWEKAIRLFSDFAETKYQPLLRDLGVALCKLHANDPTGAEFRRGQAYLEAASAPPYQDADALTSLAGTWKTLDDERARDLYRRAFEVQPSDPYAVSNYLVYEVAHQRSLAPASLMTPAILAAMQRSRDQAAVGMNLPWAFYNLGMFHLLLGKPYDSLMAYAKALELSSNYWMIETSLRLLEHLSPLKNDLAGFEWVHRLLLLGRAAKSSHKAATEQDQAALEQVKKLASTNVKPIKGPVVIVSGGTDAGVEAQIQKYRDLLLEALRDFHGTLISGGTTAGIAGLVGELQQAYPDTVKTIGYVPRLIPREIPVDERYSQVRNTTGSDFSPLELLQGWIDLLASGIDPATVKLLGINGGRIAAVEYRVALALGASVAIVRGSGREADILLQDKDWSASQSLLPLPPDPMTARALIGSGKSGLSKVERDVIAEAIHDAYRKDQHASRDPALTAWKDLEQTLQNSNREQADHMSTKLRQIGCSLHRVEKRPAKLFEFSPEEIDLLAEMEHGRWTAERLQDGWKYAEERHVGRKTSPSLVPWTNLPEQVRDWDRDAVRNMPEFLAAIGMEIRRDTP
jgi:ppGpp synthetase/RelA/SpoT-type nucleotidyltranferase